MDAETQAVFDKAWNIVDFDSLAVDDGSSARRSLIAALQEHAKAHPLKLRKEPKAWKLVELEAAVVNVLGADPGIMGANDRSRELLGALKTVWLKYANCDDDVSGLRGGGEKPPELPKKNEDSRAPDFCGECGRRLKYIHDISGVPHFLHRIDHSLNCRIVSGDSECPYLKSQRREPLVIREPLGQAKPDVIIGGQGMPTPPGYGPTPPPNETTTKGPKPEPIVGIDPGAQPTVLQLEKGDRCVVAYNQELSVALQSRLTANWNESLPGVRVRVEGGISTICVLRPAEGGEDDG